jgi:hypothetical protein
MVKNRGTGYAIKVKGNWIIIKRGGAIFLGRSVRR